MTVHFHYDVLVLLLSTQYAFFMKATELERIDISYAKTMEEVDTLQSQAARMNNTLENDRDHVAQLKKNYKQHQAVAKLETKRAKIEADHAWSVYKEARKMVVSVNAEMKVFEAKAEKRREKLSQAQAASQEGDDGVDEIRDRMDALSKEADAAANEKKELEQELKLKIEPFKALQRQIKSLRKEEARAEKNLNHAKARLQKKRDEIAAAAGSAESEQAKRNERLKELESKVNEGKQTAMEVRQEISDSQEKYAAKEQDVVEAKERLGNLENRRRGMEYSIENMQKSSGNSVSVFGPKCSAMKRRVDEYTRNRKFRGPVLGPLGAYCKVNTGKDEFAKLAEFSLGGGVLDRFLVTNDHDRRVLQSIREKENCLNDCQIFQIADVSRA